MAVYHLNVVVAEDGTVIPLRNIETMNFVRDDEDAVIDKLRDDCAIGITTLSGQKFLIYMETQIKTFNTLNSWAVKELSSAIYEKWIRLFN